jgi:hypothetical protein
MFPFINFSAKLSKENDLWSPFRSDNQQRSSGFIIFQGRSLVSSLRICELTKYSETAENAQFFKNHHYFKKNWIVNHHFAESLTGPICFEKSITTVQCQNILEEFVNQVHPDELRDSYFQQDGATAHIARMTLNYPKEFYNFD